MDSVEKTFTIYLDAQGPAATICFSSHAGVASATITTQRCAIPQSTEYFSAAGLRDIASELVRLAEFTEKGE